MRKRCEPGESRPCSRCTRMQLECVPRERPPRAPHHHGGRAPTAGRPCDILGGTFGDRDDRVALFFLAEAGEARQPAAPNGPHMQTRNTAYNNCRRRTTYCTCPLLQTSTAAQATRKSHKRYRKQRSISFLYTPRDSDLIDTTLRHTKKPNVNPKLQTGHDTKTEEATVRRN